MSQEISSLKAERRDYTAELALLQKKEAKSSWYHKQKATKSTSAGPSNESDTPRMEVNVDDPESYSGVTSEGPGDTFDLTGESEVSEQGTELSADPESPFHPGLPAPK